MAKVSQGEVTIARVSDGTNANDFAVTIGSPIVLNSIDTIIDVPLSCKIVDNNGDEIDADGTEYYYHWSLTVRAINDGNFPQMMTEEPVFDLGFTKTGKNVTFLSTTSVPLERPGSGIQLGAVEFANFVIDVNVYDEPIISY
jgi:hypothetical protein